jgi:uncharacterized damage-inducible protein DinB
MILLIQNEVKRRIFEESYSRIDNCLDRLTLDQIWHKPNQNANSIGNLVLHLLGNVRQYVCSGIGGQKDVRNRDEEFQLTSACSPKDLKVQMSLLEKDVLEVVNNLTDEKLTSVYRVQGFEESGISIIIHVIEHFSYHVGQIAQQTKLLVDQDLGFYAGLDLNAKSN